MGRLFGTDGVRGLANGDLTPELSMAVAVAAAHVLAGVEGPRPKAVVGRDPRASGEMLEAAVCAGLASAGADVTRVGVLPTPAVAHLTAAMGKPVWVLLAQRAIDWQWPRTGASPWYPTARLFAQPRPNDWAGAVDAVLQALAGA